MSRGHFNSVAGVTADGPIFIRNNQNTLGMLLAVLGINANGQTVTVDGDGKANARVSFQPGGGSIIKTQYCGGEMEHHPHNSCLPARVTSRAPTRRESGPKSDTRAPRRPALL